MPVKMRRRRVRKRKRAGENSRVKFAAFIAIMVLEVFLGYLTARFVIGPLLGYDADESPITLTGGAESDEQGEAETGSTAGAEAEAPEGGYALQFGVFSTKEAAEKLAGELVAKGIEADVIEDEEMFKVISPLIETKDEALSQLDGIRDKEVEDVFIASF